MQHETAGDPMTGLKWTHRTTAKIAEQLQALGIKVSDRTVAKLLKQMDYSLRVNHKKLSRVSPEDRDAQFACIAALRERCAAKGLPLISVDTNYARVGIMHGSVVWLTGGSTKGLASNHLELPPGTSFYGSILHNQSPSRNARMPFVGRKRCSLTEGACMALSARSFIARSASTYMWVVAVLS